VVEEADQDLRLTLATTQVPVQLSTELARRAGPSPARRIGLDVMVEQLHRVQLGAVAGQEVQLDPVGMAPDPGADRRCTGCPSTIRWTLRPSQSRSSRPRKSMNTAPVNDPVKSRNRSIPALEMALIMLTRKRLPVPLMTGVWPTGAQDRPARLPQPRRSCPLVVVPVDTDRPAGRSADSRCPRPMPHRRSVSEPVPHNGHLQWLRLGGRVRRGLRQPG
jgi:hypothetical protein